MNFFKIRISFSFYLSSLYTIQESLKTYKNEKKVNKREISFEKLLIFPLFIMYNKRKRERCECMFSSNKTQYHILDVKQIWSASVDHKNENTNEHRLFFFFRGCQSEFVINDNKMDIDNLTLLYIPKGASYTHQAIREKTIRIHFDIEGEFSAFPFALNSHIFVPLFRDISFCWNSQPNGYVPHAYSVFFTILELIQNMHSDGAHNPTYKSIHLGVEYLHRNFNDPSVSISHAAALSFLCPKRFRDLYKSVYRIPPKQAIIEMRIDHACKLLKHENLSIREVADRCGFSDVKHFSRTFHSIISLPPSKYRALFRSTT